MTRGEETTCSLVTGAKMELILCTRCTEVCSFYTAQVNETILILFFADTGQSERKPEGNIQFAVTKFIEFPIAEMILIVI